MQTLRLFRSACLDAALCLLTVGRRRNKIYEKSNIQYTPAAPHKHKPRFKSGPLNFPVRKYAKRWRPVCPRGYLGASTPGNAGDSDVLTSGVQKKGCMQQGFDRHQPFLFFHSFLVRTSEKNSRARGGKRDPTFCARRNRASWGGQGQARNPRLSLEEGREREGGREREPERVPRILIRSGYLYSTISSTSTSTGTQYQ